MLHQGRIIFEGTDERFWNSDDPIIPEFLEFDTILNEKFDTEPSAVD